MQWGSYSRHTYVYDSGIRGRVCGGAGLGIMVVYGLLLGQKLHVSYIENLVNVTYSVLAVDVFCGMNAVSPRRARSLHRPSSRPTCLWMEPHLNHSYSAILGMVILSRQLERTRETASPWSLPFCRPRSGGLWWSEK